MALFVLVDRNCREISLVATNTHYHTDLLGSPVKETNQTRITANPTYYSPCGEATNRTVDGPGYTGHRMDGGSGLIYVQQRFMDPVLGRFLSVDPTTVDETAPCVRIVVVLREAWKSIS